MKASENRALPRARSEGLIIKELPDEVLVYDLESHKAHCLNRPAAMIWKHFDGETSISKVASDVTGEIGYEVDSEVVMLALQQLRKAKLILAEDEPAKSEAQMSRRDLIKKLGLAATAIPVVTSILAPTAHAAVSCGSISCLTDGDCTAAAGTECTTCVGTRCAQ